MRMRFGPRYPIECPEVREEARELVCEDSLSETFDGRELTFRHRSLSSRTIPINHLCIRTCTRMDISARQY